jgi:hypothetical protein
MNKNLKSWYDNTKKVQTILNKLSHKDLMFLLEKSGVVVNTKETKPESIAKMLVVLHIDIPNQYYFCLQ